MPEGRIMKALSGFYYVKTGQEIISCKGRGVFRNKKITPLVGDFVVYDINDHREGYITEIKQRKNELVRPPIANVDQAVIISSAAEPVFSTVLLDRFLVLIEAKEIKPIIFITKKDKLTDKDMVSMEKFKREYEQIGYPIEFISTKSTEDVEAIKHYFKERVTVFAGQSGVGKSSLLNALQPSLTLETGEISKSLGRGKHTTRHVELVEINGGLIADTPGFSSLDFQEIELDILATCFPEFRERQHACKFRGCMHINEPKCAVKEAVEKGDIMNYRYDHYVRFYEEIQLRKPRY
ncbi:MULTISPECIES: ribosome small subunit-dependent GTPase A [unclassified Virgibacillus]|uniref:ribosome small subunit-dependent GTPase A n=1 Tax=unclassified Virgibacillus TaxID=2620237 RepID=UPI0024DF01DD|nr:ribosome small subunit-dependent GTPase A [Virgibacillus sp. LDC-1]